MTASFADHVPSQPFNLATVGSADSPFRRLLRLIHLESHALFWLCFFVTVILLLAHLTNPTEASFRAFLTELAFRRHLTKLNGAITGQPDDGGEAARLGGLTSDASSPTPPTFGPVFHFSKSATVMLRTPVNITRSFLFFTIVIVTPVSDLTASCKDRNAPSPIVLEGTWYIGALGRWWLGGVVDLPRFRRHDKKEILGSEETIGIDLKAGILGFLNLDRYYASELPPPQVASQPIRHADAKSPKVKRRRSLARQSVPNLKSPAVPPRSITPPPLPESASLPLHSARMPPGTVSNQITGSDRLPSKPHPPAVVLANGSAKETSSLSHPVAASHLASLDQSPSVADVLKQLQASQATITDLQSQMSTLSASSSVQHQALQDTLQSHREKKQLDDQARTDQKSKMKGFEDAKRAAELAKRDAEKRLKAVQAKHDAALNRIERLSDEIQGMQKTITSDENRVVKSCMEANGAEAELVKTLESKKKELKIAGDVVVALTQRAEEYEKKVKAQQEKLAKAKDVAEERHKKRMALLQQQQQHRPNLSQTSLNSRQSSQQSSQNSQVNNMPQSSPVGNFRMHARTDPIPQQQFFSPVSLNFGPVLSFGQSSFQPSLLQRRNIQDPERLMLQSSPNRGEPRRIPSFGRIRPRSASLSGNGGVTVETSGAPGFAALTSRFTRNRNGSATMHSASPGGQGFFNLRTGSSGSLDKPSPPSSILARRNSAHSQRGGSTFAPFADTDSINDDTSSISAYPTSLLPSSLVKSLDAESTRSPTSEASPYFEYDAYNGSLDHSLEESQYSGGYRRRNSDWSLPGSAGNADSFYYDQGMPSDQFSPSALHTGSVDLASPSPIQSSSPHSVNGVSPRGRYVKFANGTVYHNRTYGSSQSSFERYASASTPLETVDENRDAKHRRWFPSFINSQAGQLAVFPQTDPSLSVTKPSKNKSGLNPDAKSFTLSRGRSFLLTDSQGRNQTAPDTVDALGPPGPLFPGSPDQTAQTSLASRMYGSLTHTLQRQHPQERVQPEIEVEPPPSTPTGNFFSSLLAFAPSPAERQALQRGLETATAAASNKKSGLGKLSLLKGANGDSQDSLPVLAAQWATPESDASSTENLPATGTAPPVTTKRSISSLWLRSKPPPAMKNPVPEEAVDKPAELDLATAPAKDETPAPTQGFGSRFARFARHSQKASADTNPATGPVVGTVPVGKDDE